MKRLFRILVLVLPMLLVFSQNVSANGVPSWHDKLAEKFACLPDWLLYIIHFHYFILFG